MKKVFFVFTFLFVFGVAAETIAAQAKERVRFERGASSATATGTVRGYAYRDYLITAKAGQTVHVKLSSTGSPSVFSVFQPNKNDLDGAGETNDFRGELPVTGEYSIRVLMMRSAARRKGSYSNYTLKIFIM